MLAALEIRLRDVLRRGAAACLGAALVAIGAGFLTHAAWLALVLYGGPILAAQVIGGAYVLAGGLMLLRVRRRRIVPPPQPVSQLMLVEAFLVGLEAARGRRGARARAEGD